MLWSQDVSKHFIESLEEDVIKIYKKLEYRAVIIKGEKEDENYKQSKKCYICGGEFLLKDKNLKKVTDHCHISGKNRGAALSMCNLRYQLPTFIPVFFHNLSGYDSHLFIKNLGLYVLYQPKKH